jgi:hypothetical protein
MHPRSRPPRVQPTRSRPTSALLAWLIVLAAVPKLSADEPARPPRLSVGGPGAAVERQVHPINRTKTTGDRDPSPGGSGGWWLGALGVAVALGAFGALSLANRRARSTTEVGALEVVGRVALAPRHAAILLRAGDRTLIVGVGPQGAPSLLGELPRSAEAPELPARDVAGEGGAAG